MPFSNSSSKQKTLTLDQSQNVSDQGVAVSLRNSANVKNANNKTYKVQGKGAQLVEGSTYVSNNYEGATVGDVKETITAALGEERNRLADLSNPIVDGANNLATSRFATNQERAADEVRTAAPSNILKWLGYGLGGLVVVAILIAALGIFKHRKKA